MMFNHTLVLEGAFQNHSLYRPSSSLFNFFINAKEWCVYVCTTSAKFRHNRCSMVVVCVHTQTCALNLLSTLCDAHPVTPSCAQN